MCRDSTEFTVHPNTSDLFKTCNLPDFINLVEYVFPLVTPFSGRQAKQVHLAP